MMDELRDRAIEEHCRELKMPGMATEYDHLLREGEHPKDYLLIVVDELGYLGLGPGGPMLFQFFAERYERRSVCVTTNLDFRRWTEIFGDTTMTEAMLDRLTHHAHIFVFKRESYRFAQRVADVRSEN